MSGTANLREQLRELSRHRDLFWTWTQREVKVRYKQSLLGAAWAILQPLTLMLVFSVVFTRFVQVPTGGVPYPVFSYSALLPWTLFSTSVVLGTSSLVANMSLVTKVYFPREILPMAAVAASVVDFAVASLVLLAMMAVFGVPLKPVALVVLFLLLVQVILTTGVVLLTSALNVFYRDVRFVVPLALQLLMYASPILYSATIVPQRFRALYMLNPMAGLIEAYRAVLLTGSWPSWQSMAVSTVTSVVVFIVGYSAFKRSEWQFADVI